MLPLGVKTVEHSFTPMILYNIPSSFHIVLTFAC